MALKKNTTNKHHSSTRSQLHVVLCSCLKTFHRVGSFLLVTPLFSRDKSGVGFQSTLGSTLDFTFQYHCIKPLLLTAEVLLCKGASDGERLATTPKLSVYQDKQWL